MKKNNGKKKFLDFIAAGEQMFVQDRKSYLQLIKEMFTDFFNKHTQNDGKLKKPIKIPYLLQNINDFVSNY